MDVVYICKQSFANPELRYSLRTLKNLPHKDVYIAGGCPEFVTNVRRIEVEQSSPKKYTNAAANIVAACSNPDVSDDFILMNDDFFILEEVDSVPRLNRGPIEDVLEIYSAFNSKYYRAMFETKKFLEYMGFEDIISYELHVPMIINKNKYLKVHELIKEYKQKTGVKYLHGRTIYGNIVGYGGETISDVKIYKHNQRIPQGSQFMSSSDETWKTNISIRRSRSTFKDSSKYEK